MNDVRSESDIREEITLFLRRNFPQIKMHGGGFMIDSVNPTTGEIQLTLNGACSGCGISPMTIQALKQRLVNEIPEITSVDAKTTENRDTSESGGLPDDLSESPADVSGAPF